jgi:hypothetical protein
MIRFTSLAGSLSACALVLNLSALSALAQADAAPADSLKSGWKRQFNGLLSLSQAKYDNWAKGGNDAMAYELNFSGSALKDREHDSWETKGKALYGRTKVGDAGSRKSSDELNLETIYTYKLSVLVNPFAAATAQTQFMPGYNYPDAAPRVRISEFFDPAFFTETVGAAFTPYKNLKERLGGTMKQTLADKHGWADDKETAGEVETFKQEYGVSSITEYALELMENIKASTRFELFANFKGMEEVDLRWSNQVTAKVNSLISVNFEYEALYDRDLDKSTQQREGLNVGISFL